MYSELKIVGVLSKFGEVISIKGPWGWSIGRWEDKIGMDLK